MHMAKLGPEQQARARPRPGGTSSLWGPVEEVELTRQSMGRGLGGPWRSGHGGLALPGPWKGSQGSRSCPCCGPVGSVHPLSPFTDEETEAEELGGHKGWGCALLTTCHEGVPASCPGIPALLPCLALGTVML